MVRVVKLGSVFFGVLESQIEGDFWEEAEKFVLEGEPVIIADTMTAAQGVCSEQIRWIDD